MSNAAESASDNPQLSDDINVLEAEVAKFTHLIKECEKRIRELMDAEDPKQGVFHHEEIFQLQQDKLRYDVEAKFRRNKINRLELGMDETQVSPGVKDGFLF